MVNAPSRLVSLDCLRGIAITLVMWNHFTLLDPRYGGDYWWTRLLRAGGGVDLFFLLSGLLVTLVILRAKETGNRSLRNIYVSRILRVWPLYFAVVGFALLILPMVDHPKIENFARVSGDEWYYFLFLQTIPIAESGQFRHAIVDITWSLAIQEQFFWFWPLAVWYMNRRFLIGTCVVICVLSFSFRAVLAMMEASPVAIYVLTPGRLDILAVGSLLALTFHIWSDRSRFTAIAILLATIPLLAYPAYGISKQSLWEYDFLVFGLSLRLAFWMAVIFLFVQIEQFFPAFRNVRVVRIFVWISVFSYSLYLTHLPVRAVLRDMLYGGSFDESGLLGVVGEQMTFYVAATVVCLVAAYVTFQWIERPILRWRNRRLCSQARILGSAEVR